MVLKVLLRRDSTENYILRNFIPKKLELVAAYTSDSTTIIYKLGDGKTPWIELPEITKISELDKFIVYTPDARVETLLNPFLTNDFLDKYDETVRPITDKVDKND